MKRVYDVSTGEVKDLPLDDLDLQQIQERTPTVSQAAADCMARINAACEAELAQVRATYPLSEVMSWEKQEREARAYAADTTSPTPLLSALATARGVTLDDLARRVITKADAYATAVGGTLGKRQRIEDQVSTILAGTDTDDAKRAAFAAVTWN